MKYVLKCLCGCAFSRDFVTFDEALLAAQTRYRDHEIPSQIVNAKGEIVFETATIT